MRSLTIIDDPTFVDIKRFTAFESIFLPHLRDERDLSFIRLLLKATLVIVPFAAFLFTSVLTGWLWWVAAVVYLAVNIGLFMAPFTLLLHNTSHRKLFKAEAEVGNYYIPWFMGLFFGQSPDTYFSHHIGMHHPENNLANDESSTMSYQRDSFWGFMHYFLSFLFRGVIDVTNYFRKRKLHQFVRRFLRGEFSFVILCFVLCFVHWQATLVVFVIPFVYIRFGMMAGNWGQHAFIDAEDPANNFRNSINCINCTYNRQCFNDGYHIGHHLKPTLHWTELPQDFLKNREEYAANGAIVFEGLDFFQVWFLLMTKRYDVLAKRYVDISGDAPSQESIIDLLKSRTRRISHSAQAA